jgi:hypothetical protein
MKSAIAAINAVIRECRAEAQAAAKRKDTVEAAKLYYGVHWLEKAKRDVIAKAK